MMNRRSFLKILGAAGAVVVAPIAFNSTRVDAAPVEELKRFPINIDSMGVYDPSDVYTYFDGTRAVNGAGNSSVTVKWRDQNPNNTDTERVNFIAKDYRTGETIVEFSGVITNLEADMEEITTYSATLEDVQVIG